MFSKTLRFYLRLLQGIFTKYLFIIILSSVLGAAAFYSLPKLVQFIPLKPSKQTIGIVGKFSPSSLPPDVTSLSSTGLTTISPDGSVLPAIARSWEGIDNSRTFRFELDPNAHWQDGTPVKAADINFSFKDVEISPISENVIEFKLKDSYTPFPVTVSRPIFKDKNMGVGEYRITRIRSNNQVVSSVDLKPTSKSGSPNISFSFYPTEETAITAFKLGSIRELRDISSTGDLTGWPGAKVSQNTQEDRYVALFFNTQKDPYSDKDIRQALAYALDKTSYPNRAITPINSSSWAYNPQVKLYDKDLSKTSSIIKKSQVNTDEWEIQLTAFPWLLRDAEVIKRQWEAAGLKVNVHVVNFLPDDFDVLLATQAAPSDPDQYALWHSTQSSNITRLKNPKIDKLLEDGRKTEDKNDRTKIYLDFQRFLIEESPAIFLYHPITYTISR